MSTFTITVTSVSLHAGPCNHPNKKIFSPKFIILGDTEYSDDSASKEQCRQLSNLKSYIEFEVLKPNEKSSWNDANKLGIVRYIQPSDDRIGFLSILVACQGRYFNHLCDYIIKPYLQNTQLELTADFDCNGFKYDANYSKIESNFFNEFLKGFMLEETPEGKRFKDNALQLINMNFSLRHSKEVYLKKDVLE